MTQQEAKELVEHRLARFINIDLEQQNNQFDLTHTVVKVLQELKRHRFTVVSDFSPYYEFVGITFVNGNAENCYSQRGFI